MPEMKPSTTCWARRSSREMLAMVVGMQETARVVFVLRPRCVSQELQVSRYADASRPLTLREASG